MSFDHNAYDESMKEEKLRNESYVNHEHHNEREKEEKVVGFWMRVGAYITDIILISSISGILLSPLVLLEKGEEITLSLWTLNGILALIIYYLYFSIMTKVFNQTLGKMIFGIKVIGNKNDQLTWTDVFYREIVGRVFYNVFFILKFLYIIVGVTENKQGLHDMIGDTRVVYI